MLPLRALRENRAAIGWIRHSWWHVFSPKWVKLKLFYWFIVNERKQSRIPCQNIAAQTIHPNGTEFSSVIRSFWSPDRIRHTSPFHCHSYRIIEMQFCTKRLVCIANLRMLEIQRTKWGHLCSYRQCPLVMSQNPAIEKKKNNENSLDRIENEIAAAHLVEILFGK